MDFATLSPFINLGAIGIGFGVFLKFFIKQIEHSNKRMESFMDSILHQITKIADGIDKTELPISTAIVAFEALMGEHISKKIDYIKDVLVANNLENRREQIKNNIKNIFTEITQTEINRLGLFTLKNGYDLSNPLQQVNLDVFIEETYALVFSEEKDIIKKIRDIKSMMYGYVNKLRAELIQLSKK